MDPSYRNPYTQQINVGFQYAPNNFSVIEVDYVQARGLHDDKTVNINPMQYFGAIRHAAFLRGVCSGWCPVARPHRG